MTKRFNIRVYGLLIQNGQILVNEELIAGKRIIKFPGGGLDWGEGTHDCLKREWLEELQLDINVLDHFYTTDYFQPSAFDDSQIISIYYTIDAQVPENIINQESNERTYWLSISDIGAHTFTLPIDKIVGQLLRDKYLKS